MLRGPRAVVRPRKKRRSIAEEVAKVYPELVIRYGTGEIQGVHYDEFAPMLLGEMQTLRAELQARQPATQSLTQQVAELCSHARTAGGAA